MNTNAGFRQGIENELVQRFKAFIQGYAASGAVNLAYTGHEFIPCSCGIDVVTVPVLELLNSDGINSFYYIPSLSVTVYTAVSGGGPCELNVTGIYGGPNPNDVEGSYPLILPTAAASYQNYGEWFTSGLIFDPKGALGGRININANAYRIYFD